MRVVRTKLFKSGNAVAVRFPKSWGVVEGTEYEIIAEDDGSLRLRPVATDADTLRDLYGAFSPDFLKNGRGDVDQQERTRPALPGRQDAA